MHQYICRLNPSAFFTSNKPINIQMINSYLNNTVYIRLINRQAVAMLAKTLTSRYRRLQLITFSAKVHNN